MQYFSNDGNTPLLHPQFVSSSRMVRGLAGLSCAMGLWLTAQPTHADSLPRRNLLVEWRVNSQEHSLQRAAGLQKGRVVVDSRSGVSAQARGNWQNTETSQLHDSVQQVQVLNGGRARLYVGQTQPYTSWTWAWSGNNSASSTGNGTDTTSGSSTSGSTATSGTNATGASLVAQTVWIDLGEGLNVRPRWPGGRADVEVELEARASHAEQPGGFDSGRLEPDGQIRRMEVASTLRVPLGQWVVVARQGAQAQGSQNGSWSTRDVDQAGQAQLEIRVTLP